MRKAIALVLLLCVFSVLSVHAEDKLEVQPESTIYKLIQSNTVCIEAIQGRSTSMFVNGVVTEGSAKETTVVTSLDIVLRGYDNFYLHFAGTEKRKKSSKAQMDFEHNLLYLTFKLSSKFGNFASKKSQISTRLLVLGETVYVGRTVPGDDYPAQVFKGVTSNEIKFKKRSSLFGIHLNVSENVKSSLLGSPVFDKYGTVIGIMNTDVSEELFPRNDAYTEDLLIHPGKDILDGDGKSDKFPKQKGLQTIRGFTGLWMPLRFGPLTPAWREALDIARGTRGVVVVYKYQADTSSIKIGDLVTHIDGFPARYIRGVSTASPDVNDVLSGLFLSYRATGGATTLTVIRDGEEMEISVPLARHTGAAGYACQLIDMQFIELGEFTRVRADLNENVSGILCTTSLSQTMNVAYLKGLAYTIVKQVNGRSFTSLDEFKTYMESLSTGQKVRFLVLDFTTFKHKYVTLTTGS